MTDHPPVQRPSDVWLSATRHLIPVFALLFFWALASVRVDSLLVQFTIGASFVIGASLLVAALTAVYSRSRTVDLFILRTRNTAWALTLLLLLSLVPSYLVPPISRAPATESSSALSVPSGASTTLSPAEQAAQLQPFSPVAHQPPDTAPNLEWPLNPEGHSLLKKMRTDYPSLKDSSDEEVVRAVHMAFYKDLHLSQVAAKFGMRLRD